MRKLISYLHASLDGFVQTKTDWDLNWVSYDDALEGYAREILSTVDSVLWGRVTFMGMQSYWSTVPANPASSEHERNHAAWLEKTPKFVASTTLTSSDWNNTTIIKNNLAEEVMKIKQQPGKNIIILGSPKLTHVLNDIDLIDEYYMTLNPVLLGDGVPHFITKRQVKLNLLESKTFASGVIGLHYERKRN